VQVPVFGVPGKTSRFRTLGLPAVVYIAGANQNWRARDGRLPQAGLAMKMRRFSHRVRRKATLKIIRERVQNHPTRTENRCCVATCIVFGAGTIPTSEISPFGYVSVRQFARSNDE
jgi:hypothetical protein